MVATSSSSSAESKPKRKSQRQKQRERMEKTMNSLEKVYLRGRIKPTTNRSARPVLSPRTLYRKRMATKKASEEKQRITNAFRSQTLEQILKDMHQTHTKTGYYDSPMTCDPMPAPPRRYRRRQRKPRPRDLGRRQRLKPKEKQTVYYPPAGDWSPLIRTVSISSVSSSSSSSSSSSAISVLSTTEEEESSDSEVELVVAKILAPPVPKIRRPIRRPVLRVKRLREDLARPERRIGPKRQRRIYSVLPPQEAAYLRKVADSLKEQQQIIENARASCGNLDAHQQAYDASYALRLQCLDQLGETEAD